MIVRLEVSQIYDSGGWSRITSNKTYMYQNCQNTIIIVARFQKA